MMELVIVRHGHPAVPESGPTGNPPLSERGHAQARAVCTALAREPIAALWSSGMARADSTAAPFVAHSALPLSLHKGLGEIDREGGEYANVEMVRARGKEEWRTFLKSPIAYFGVDPVRFRRETLDAFAEIFAAHQDIHRRVAVFTHGFPINILLSHALGLEDDARFVPNYGSITRVAGRSLDRLTVVSINETGHIPRELRGAGKPA